MTSIHEALGRLWDANDDDRMLECGGHWAAWGAVRSLTERIDRELTAAGCQTGGRVAVVLSNRMESVAALIAIFRGGRTLVTVSPASSFTSRAQASSMLSPGSTKPARAE